MKRILILKLLFVLLCMVSLAGCQSKPVNTDLASQEENLDTGEDNDTEKDSGAEKENSAVKENSAEKEEDIAAIIEEAETIDKESEVIYEPTIEKPELLFDNIELTKAFKEIGYHNPILTQRFGADPFAMVYDGRVYVYSTADVVEYDGAGNSIENTYGKIKSLNCISSEDLVNWTDHGTIKVGGYGGGSIWANNSWAPSAIHKKIDGKDQFFLYFANNASSIGVLRSDSSVGPFLDPIGKPLITKQTENCADVKWLFDPAVFIDDDGQGYLYFGGGVPEGQEENPDTARVVKLGEDMISLVGTPEVIKAPYLFEASGMNKIGDTYYYTYCSNWSSRDNAVGPYKPGAAEIIYMTGDNPMGPWEYQGSILKNPGKFFGSYGNNHHSIINFKDQWYIFYHTQVLADAMGIKGGYRSIHVDKLIVNEDGSLQSVKASKFGVDQLSNLDPYKVTEAETFVWMGGVSTKKIEESSNAYGVINNAVTEISTGDWIGLSDVDFGVKAPTKFKAKVSSEYEGNVIKIVTDRIGGDSIGYLEVPKTESMDSFVEVTVKVSEITGVHDLFFIFSGEGFQFDSWNFVQ